MGPLLRKSLLSRVSLDRVYLSLQHAQENVKGPNLNLNEKHKCSHFFLQPKKPFVITFDVKHIKQKINIINRKMPAADRHDLNVYLSMD